MARRSCHRPRGNRCSMNALRPRRLARRYTASGFGTGSRSFVTAPSRNSTCDIANDATFHLRREDFMAWPLFCRLMDEAAPHIRELYFYNYGEPFAHPKALDMLAYAKQVNPKLEITTSTNGILLAREGVAERIVGEGLLDYVCFTVGGCDQETYAGYHKAGSFEKAFHGMRRMMEEKRRTNAAKPFVHWRYLLFNWNDGDEHIARAFELRDEIGVDELKFMLSWTPAYGRSLRRAPGTPGFQAIAPDIAFQDGYCPEPFGEAGLWQPESSPGLGAFCWTTKKARLLVKPLERKLTLKLARNEFATVPPPTVKISLPWGSVDGQVGMSAWRENVFDLPQEFSAGDVGIELDIDPIFSPLRHGESDDGRDLGVMVSMDGVTPMPNPFRLSAVSLTPVVDRTRGEAVPA